VTKRNSEDKTLYLHFSQPLQIAFVSACALILSLVISQTLLLLFMISELSFETIDAGRATVTLFFQLILAVLFLQFGAGGGTLGKALDLWVGRCGL